MARGKKDLEKIVEHTWFRCMCCDEKTYDGPKYKYWDVTMRDLCAICSDCNDLLDEAGVNFIVEVQGENRKTNNQG